MAILDEEINVIAPQKKQRSNRNSVHLRQPSQCSSEPTDPRPGWRALFAFTTKPHLTLLYFATALSAGSGLTEPTFAILLGKIFDQFTDFGAGTLNSQALRNNVARYSIIVAGLGIASWLLNSLFFFSWLAFGELQAKVSHSRIFQGLVEKPSAWYDLRKSGVGALIPRLQS